MTLEDKKAIQQIVLDLFKNGGASKKVQFLPMEAFDVASKFYVDNPIAVHITVGSTSIASSSHTTLKGTQDFANGNISYSASTGLVTINVPGKYLVGVVAGWANFPGQSSLFYEVDIYKNGASAQLGVNWSGAGITMNLSDYMNLASGDTLGFNVYQSNSGANSTTIGGNPTYWYVVRV